MANFRLKLITPNNDKYFSLASNETRESFLTSIITDFDDQREQHQHNAQVDYTQNNNLHAYYGNSFTYNEKLSLHKHGQKELTFQMDDKVFLNNEWIENPYAHILRNGIQIELTDKYNNCMLFTVQKINYTFNNLNIVYNVTCQDSFTYQLTRQNEGYTIQNDESSLDYIGALDIDQWAEKVVQECYITYTYIPLDTGIYQDINNGINTFAAPGDDIEDEPDITTLTTDRIQVNKIIKPIYNKKKYEDFYTTFPFSISGSNAAATLIAMADQLGLQLNIVEGYDNSAETSGVVVYKRFFYFGPVKNPENTGLSYSPTKDIQAFSLSFSGDSLTTVLNIKSTTWENEEIGLFPKIPVFISSVIMNENNWTNSQYYEGYFTDLVKGKVYTDPLILNTEAAFNFPLENQNNNQEEVEEDEEITPDQYVLVPFNRNSPNFTEWPLLYNQIAFSMDDQHLMSFFAGEKYTPRSHQMGIAIAKDIDGIQISDLFTTVPESQISMGTIWYDVTDKLVDANFIMGLFQEQVWDTEYHTVHYKVFLEKITDQGTPKIFLGGYVDDQEGTYTGYDLRNGSPWIASLTIDSDYFLSEDTTFTFYPEYTDIPIQALKDWNEGKTQLYVYIKQAHLDNEQVSILDHQCFIRPTRAYTQEELDFANSAEVCPWLENKLINFTYFYKLGVISRAEYENLTHLITNDLRIINGQLMCYATAYYESLHKQTKILAELQAAIDKLGAVFYADVVDPYLNSGAIGANTGDFLNAYNKLFVTVETTPTPLLNLNNLISDYFNKYFNANQRFLKNIYYFRKYFEAPNIYAVHGENTLENVTYTATVSGDTNNLLVGFNKTINWTRLTNSSPIIIKDSLDNPSYTIAQLYNWNSDHYVQQKIPNPQNYKEFYIAEEVAGNQVQIATGSTVAYNPRNTYLWKLDSNDTSFYNTFGENFRKSDLITLNGQQYVKLGYSHIVKWFLHTNINLSDRNTRYYLRDTKTKVPLEWIRCDKETLTYAFDPLLWPGMEDLQKYLDTDYFENNKTDKNWDYAWSLYKAMMPINNVYLRDYCLNSKPNEQDSTQLDWYVTDENNNKYTYIDNNQWKHYNPITKEDEIVTTDKLYKKYFTINLLNYQGNLSSIFSSDNDVSVTIKNLYSVNSFLTSWAKDANYYTKKICFNWGAFWGRVALKAALLTPFCALVPSPWSIQWTPAGATDYKLELDGTWQWELNESGGWKANLGDSDHAYRGDSYYINYVKSADAEETIKDLTNSSSNLRQSLYGNTTTNSYANYYKYVVFTYSTESSTHDLNEDICDNYVLDTNTTRLYAQNKYATICTQDSVFNPQDTYLWVSANIYRPGSNNNEAVNYELIKVDEDQFPNILSSTTGDLNLDWDHRFSAIKFYGITEGKEELILSNFFTKAELDEKQTLKSLVEKAHNTPGEPESWSFDEDYPNQIIIGNHRYYIIHLEPYECALINPTIYDNTVEGYINPNRYTISYKTIKATDKAYHYTTNLPLTVNELTIKGDTHLSYLPESDGNLQKISDLIQKHQADEEWTDQYWNQRDNYHWYATPALESRTYTVGQILDADTGLNYYYIDNSILSTSEILKKDWEIDKNFTINLWTYELNTDKTIIINDLIQNLPVTLSFNENKLESSTEIKTLTGKNITLTITRDLVESIEIGNISNGEFWYRFHNRLDIPDLLEKVIVIETELTNYWNQAYTASQYCEWFLPPVWTSENDKNVNYFAGWIYHIGTNGHVELCTSFLPEVEIYQYNNQTILPKLQFYYNFKDLKHLYHLSEIPHAINNPAIAAIMQQVWPNNDNSYNYLDAQEQGTTTYYYRVGGGLEWKNVLHFLKPTAAIYDSFNGLYPMQLNIFLNQYVQSNATLYEKTLNDKLMFWKNLYARFPGIFLENTYENKDARSSQQLLQMAQLAFADYTEPEKQYNITLIDAQSLEGFQGQELKLGDSILLKPQEYYNDIDETYRALNQYLFISDISYTLRSDTDIALTVNIIKYQDKLLQSIVKLIR